MKVSANFECAIGGSSKVWDLDCPEHCLLLVKPEAGLAGGAKWLIVHIFGTMAIAMSLSVNVVVVVEVRHCAELQCSVSCDGLAAAYWL